jgi:hypothetical protein
MLSALSDWLLAVSDFCGHLHTGSLSPTYRPAQHIAHGQQLADQVKRAHSGGGSTCMGVHCTQAQPVQQVVIFQELWHTVKPS